MAEQIQRTEPKRTETPQAAYDRLASECAALARSVPGHELQIIARGGEQKLSEPAERLRAKMAEKLAAFRAAQKARDEAHARDKAALKAAMEKVASVQPK